MTSARAIAYAGAIAGWPAAACAHASEQGFVLILPTDFYIGAGVAVVVLTLAATLLLPARAFRALYRLYPLGPAWSVPAARRVSSLLSLVFLGWLVAIGMSGAHDPLSNPLPLTVWTVFWTLFVVWQGLYGTSWAWVDPWSGLLAVCRRAGLRPVFRLPSALGHWPGLASFLCFAAVLLAHPAPTDPESLARMVAVYWLAHFAAGLLMGPRWLRRAEGFTLLMDAYARIAPRGRHGARHWIGLPGWRALRVRPPIFSGGVFMVAVLAVGSFDGLNETFHWLALIGVNPLEFPGRSAVILPTLTGLAIAIPLLVLAYATAVAAGLRLAGIHDGFFRAFGLFAPSLMPIALGYHLGHYLPGFLVEIQYVARVVSDPLDTGANLIGMTDHLVTTGFFNTRDSVRVIWLAQAGAVVAGHVLAILLAHALALKTWADPRRAFLAGLPLAVLMVGYTLFGLWLLAAPRGL